MDNFHPIFALLGLALSNALLHLKRFLFPFGTSDKIGDKMTCSKLCCTRKKMGSLGFDVKWVDFGPTFRCPTWEKFVMTVSVIRVSLGYIWEIESLTYPKSISNQFPYTPSLLELTWWAFQWYDILYQNAFSSRNKKFHRTRTRVIF